MAPAHLTSSDSPGTTAAIPMSSSSSTESIDSLQSPTSASSTESSSSSTNNTTIKSILRTRSSSLTDDLHTQRQPNQRRISFAVGGVVEQLDELSSDSEAENDASQSAVNTATPADSTNTTTDAKKKRRQRKKKVKAPKSELDQLMDFIEGTDSKPVANGGKQRSKR